MKNITSNKWHGDQDEPIAMAIMDTTLCECCSADPIGFGGAILRRSHFKSLGEGFFQSFDNFHYFIAVSFNPSRVVSNPRVFVSEYIRVIRRSLQTIRKFQHGLPQVEELPYPFSIPWCQYGNCSKGIYNRREQSRTVSIYEFFWNIARKRLLLFAKYSAHIFTVLLCSLGYGNYRLVIPPNLRNDACPADMHCNKNCTNGTKCLYPSRPIGSRKPHPISDECNRYRSNDSNEGEDEERLFKPCFDNCHMEIIA